MVNGKQGWERQKKVLLWAILIVLLGLVLLLLKSSPPQIISASVYPLKIMPGQVMIVTVQAKDALGIKSATAIFENEKMPDERNIPLITGTRRDGVYETRWIAHDTLNQKYYNTTIIFTNFLGKKTQQSIEWQDPTESHTADKVMPGTFGAGDYVFPNNLTVTGNVNWNASNMNPTNLLSNGDFESWSAGTSAAPDGWTDGGGGSIAREATTIKMGTYSLKNIGLVSDSHQIIQSTHAARGIAYWRNRTVALGCWAYATAANAAKIYIYDGVSSSTTGVHTGDSTWQWLSVTHTIHSLATMVRANVFVLSAGSVNTAYFDGCMLVEGSTPFAFSDKPAAEGVWADYGATSTVVGWTGETPIIYVKKIGKIVFVTYDISGTSDTTGATFTVPYTSAAGVGTRATWGYGVDNSAGLSTPGLAYLPASSTTVTLYKDGVGSAWTGSGTKQATGQFWYESA